MFSDVYLGSFGFLRPGRKPAPSLLLPATINVRSSTARHSMRCIITEFGVATPAVAVTWRLRSEAATGLLAGLSARRRARSEVVELENTRGVRARVSYP